jgi:hypothetical protein
VIKSAGVMGREGVKVARGKSRVQAANSIRLPRNQSILINILVTGLKTMISFIRVHFKLLQSSRLPEGIKIVA